MTAAELIDLLDGYDGDLPIQAEVFDEKQNVIAVPVLEVRFDSRENVLILELQAPEE